MKSIFLVLSLCWLISCSSFESQNEEQNIVQINLGKDLVFNWDNRSHAIVKDSLWDNLISIYNTNHSYGFIIAEKITSTEETPAKVCSIERNLVMGDLAFLVIGSIENIADFEVYGVQWDIRDSNCQYPLGMFDAVHRHREETRDDTIKYLKEIKSDSN